MYLTLGDSLAWGDGASIPSETAYVPLLGFNIHPNDDGYALIAKAHRRALDH